MSTIFKVFFVIVNYLINKPLNFISHPDAGLPISVSIFIVLASGSNSESYLPTDEFLGKYGYPLERHTVVTEDGYLLTAHRIPHGKHSNGTNRYPVLCIHGTGGVGEMFLFPGYGKGIGWYLADRDFDIWLLNTRGNYHSRKHRKWNPDKDPEFWNFSWHEVGVYDLPAAIDHILTVTNKSKLFYVGHSQGSTVYLVLTTQRPEYNDKIALGVNLAPSAFIGDNNYLLMELVGKHRLLFKSVMKGIGFHEVLPFNLNRLVRTLMRFVCSEINVFVDVCNIVFNFPDNTHQVDPATFQLIFSYVPAGCSLKQLNHYLQIVESNSFALYDYGRRENKKYYGQVKPPIYNLENITAPTAYFYGTHDVITKPEGIAKLISKTKNIEVYKIEQGFNHVDFLFSKNVIEIVNKPLYSMMKKYVVNID